MSSEKLEARPNRLELLKLKQRKALAEGIADILQKDLEALISTLIEYRRRENLLRSQLYEKIHEAYSLFIESEMIMGVMKTKEILLSAPPISFDIKVNTTPGVLGSQFPIFNLVLKEKNSLKLEPRFSLLETPIQLEKVVSKVNNAINLIVKIAELTAGIRILLEMISLKRRQINRLRFKVIPQLDSTIRYIELMLDEIERQDAIRVRVLQRKRKELAEKL